VPKFKKQLGLAQNLGKGS